MNNLESLNTTIATFESLNLTEWKVVGGIKDSEGGQSDVIEVLNIKSNEKGVFRLLRRKKKLDIDRFNRELKILTNKEYKHPNIVEILDYSKDLNSQWYISKLGIQFYPYWHAISKSYKGNPNQRLKKAISIILEICEGLIPLHKAKVVHRDIKPRNIIIQNNRPQLIDFGIAFVEGEERLTPLHDAVGNAGFSHDIQMNRLEDVPAWLDIFQLSQLLIWMTQKNPTKRWTRALHWAFVIYPKSTSDENLLKIKAITAKCSNPFTSPSDAQELKDLILILFNESEKMGPNNQDLSHIQKTIAKGKALQIIASSDARSIFEAECHLFLKFTMDFENKLNELFNSIKPSISISFSNIESTAQEWVTKTLNSDFSSRLYRVVPMSFTCGEEPYSFKNDITYIFFTEKIKGDNDFSKYPNKFLIVLSICINDKLTQNKMKTFCISLNPNGLLVIDLLYGNQYGTMSLENFMNDIRKFITDKEVWNLLIG